MSNRILKRTGRVTAALAVGCAFVAPGAQAAAINLASASPFVVLGGAGATNVGPSVLNGALGDSPTQALSGFNTAVVNGPIHDNDAVAAQAQLDVGTAYDVAAAEPTSQDLTGTNLGNRTLTAGVYSYSSSAQLTGPLVLNAQGNPNARFVFNISSALTTASASSVLLINGASPCNVYWRVGTSATLGSTTRFKGNLMALASVSLNNAATVQGRLFARSGSVTLINNVLDGSMCGTDTTNGSGTAGTGGTGGTATTPAAPPASRSATPTRAGTARLRRPTRSTTSRRNGGPACTAGFHATVTGRMIRRVIFRLDGKRIGTRYKPAFRQYVKAASAGRHVISARVGFKDATHSKTLKFRYRACAAQVLRPRQGPSQFTG